MKIDLRGGKPRFTTDQDFAGQNPHITFVKEGNGWAVRADGIPPDEIPVLGGTDLEIWDKEAGSAYGKQPRPPEEWLENYS